MTMNPRGDVRARRSCRLPGEQGAELARELAEQVRAEGLAMLDKANEQRRLVNSANWVAMQKSAADTRDSAMIQLGMYGGIILAAQKIQEGLL